MHETADESSPTAEPFQPQHIESLRLGDVILRPLRADDTQMLGDYFLGLSAATKRFYAPHPFDRETAVRLTDAIDLTEAIRLLAVKSAASSDKVIGYFILKLGCRKHEAGRFAGYGIRLQPEHCACLAPSIADTAQNCGLGGIMLRRSKEILLAGDRRDLLLMGGVRGDNPRARHFYQKHGFREVGTFQAGGVENYDMILDLRTPVSST